MTSPSSSGGGGGGGRRRRTTSPPRPGGTPARIGQGRETQLGSLRDRSLTSGKRNKPVHDIPLSKRVIRACAVATTQEQLAEMVDLGGRWDKLTATAQRVLESWAIDHKT